MKINECDLMVDVCGEGHCIVLLHGWGQSRQQMAMLQKDLSSQYCVVNLDLAGFGKSEEPPYPWTIETYSDVLYDLLQELHLEKPLIIAHSFGARIALHYAHKYHCQGLILTGAAGIKAPRTLNYYLKVYAYKVIKHFKKDAQMGSVDFQKASPMMRKILVQCVNEDISDLLPEINAVTLLVWGKQDQVTPLWMGKKMERLLPNAYLVQMKGGHFAYLNHSHFIKIVEAYLKEAF